MGKKCWIVLSVLVGVLVGLAVPYIVDFLEPEYAVPHVSAQNRIYKSGEEAKVKVKFGSKPRTDCTLTITVLGRKSILDRKSYRIARENLRKVEGPIWKYEKVIEYRVPFSENMENAEVGLVSYSMATADNVGIPVEGRNIALLVQERNGGA